MLHNLYLKLRCYNPHQLESKKKIIMKKNIYAEMMVHVPLCTHKEPQDVLLISNTCDELTKEIDKHSTQIKHRCATQKDLSSIDADSADIIVCDIETDALTLSHITRILKSDGLITLDHPSLEDKRANEVLMGILSNSFKIIMPYRLDSAKTLLLASRSTHPTADLNLHRCDMLDDLTYYNCDIHIGSFAMGTQVRKEYLGLFKN